MRGWWRGLVLVVGMLTTGVACASPGCPAQQIELSGLAQVLEDPGGTLTADQVLALPESAFSPATREFLPYQYSRSAFWLRLRLPGDFAGGCPRWLTVGDPRLSDVQVFIREDGQWRTMRAGAAYPLQQWPAEARQPSFPLELSAARTLTLLIRVTSDSVLIIEPQLWSELGLLEHRQNGAMADGMTLGLTLLMVPFSFVVGWILRSRLLVAHALTLVTYAMLVSVVNGYLVHVPVLLPWSWALMWGLGLAQYCLLLVYFRVLFQVRQLPPVWGRVYDLFIVLMLICHGWMLVDNIEGRMLFDWARKAVYLLLTATLLAGWRRGVIYSWLVYLVYGLVMLQALVRLLSVAGVPWQSTADVLSVTSTLPGLLLLAGTLALEVGRVRARERRALEDLDNQQKAEHERLESTVAMRTRQLRESLRARSLLMARISHDLRSPLASIVNYARLLPPDLPEDYPRRIERNARRQLELIDELLEFSRSELQQLEIVLAPGYLYGFLQEIQDEGGFLAAQQNNRFEARLDPQLPTLVQADFRRLRQILINLLANAAKFTRDGQVLFEVRCLACDAGSARLRFAVLDTGIGIPPEERKYLSQPFWRGREARRFAGTGLGLSTVKELLQQMGSTLVLDETQARGTGFSFEVAFARAREEDLDSSFEESHGVWVDGRGRYVLLVDDVEHNRDWLSDLLGGYGFDVTAVAGVPQALDVLRHASCDLLISDQSMPGMDGWALLSAVRERWPALPVLLYSSAPPLRPSGYPDGLAFDAVLLKPSDTATLLAAIERVAPGSHQSADAVPRGMEG